MSAKDSAYDKAKRRVNELLLSAVKRNARRVLFPLASVDENVIERFNEMASISSEGMDSPRCGAFDLRVNRRDFRVDLEYRNDLSNPMIVLDFHPAVESSTP